MKQKQKKKRANFGGVINTYPFTSHLTQVRVCTLQCTHLAALYQVQHRKIKKTSTEKDSLRFTWKLTNSEAVELKIAQNASFIN